MTLTTGKGIFKVEILTFHNIDPTKIMHYLRIASNVLIKKQNVIVQLFTPKNMITGRLVKVKDNEGTERDLAAYSISRL